MYIVLFLHQTTTSSQTGESLTSCISYYSYIKPQQEDVRQGEEVCCISYYSYIKPQRLLPTLPFNIVVYRTIPTSNHNAAGQTYTATLVVYRTIPTSNHNSLINWLQLLNVVYRTIPTSNHNIPLSDNRESKVVYRTIPTSNHNGVLKAVAVEMLYIVLFLHQTTTQPCVRIITESLYIVLFLHQTTTYNGDIADNQHVTITFINKK